MDGNGKTSLFLSILQATADFKVCVIIDMCMDHLQCKSLQSHDSMNVRKRTTVGSIDALTAPPTPPTFLWLDIILLIKTVATKN